MRNETIKISILMACYNSSNFIERSINSVVTQTYKNWELLCINDMSTDNTLEKLNCYAKKDSRIKILNKTSRGGKAAPNFNYALEHVNGDFIFLLGHDDSISEDLLENLVNRQKQTNADIVIPDCKFVYSEDETKNWTIAGVLEQWGKDNKNIDRNIILSSKRAVEYSLGWQIHGFNMYNTSIVKKIRFEEEGMNGDEYSVREFYLHANKIAFCKGVYNYFQNQESITKKMTPKVFDTYKTPYWLERLLIDNKFSYNLIQNIDNSRKDNYKRLLCLYKDNISSFSEEEQIKIQQLLSDNQKLLNEFSLKKIFGHKKILLLQKIQNYYFITLFKHLNIRLKAR